MADDWIAKRICALRSSRLQILDAPDEYKWLFSLLRRLRPDLCAMFAESANPDTEFLKWIITSGIFEYAALTQSPGLKALFWQPVNAGGLSLLQTLLYSARKDVQQAFPLHSPQFKVWFYQNGIDEHRLHGLLTDEQCGIYQQFHPEYQRPGSSGYRANGKFGVNLIGYARGQLGIGENLRLLARTLQHVGIPFTIIDFTPEHAVPHADHSMDLWLNRDGLLYNINIFCMTALETARFYLEKGRELFRDYYNIGYWPWELKNWPGEWRDLTVLVDEIWVLSRHISDSLLPQSPVPVWVMPSPVDTGQVSPKIRKDFGLPQNAYLFCFSFDPNSSIHRKNPQACLKAFQKAFPPGKKDAVGLVIKTHKVSRPDKNWDCLARAARKDPRIFIIERTLAKSELMALYKCCDCYLSLHRAEGYGLGIAEAMLLGLRVITTGYSGNVDFCANHPQAWLAPYSMVPVQDGQYPYARNQSWANPDIGAVARLMRKARAEPQIPIQTKLNHQLFSFEGCGRRIAERLRFLGHPGQINIENVCLRGDSKASPGQK